MGTDKQRKVTMMERRRGADEAGGADEAEATDRFPRDGDAG